MKFSLVSLLLCAVVAGQYAKKSGKAMQRGGDMQPSAQQDAMLTECEV